MLKLFKKIWGNFRHKKSLDDTSEGFSDPTKYVKDPIKIDVEFQVYFISPAEVKDTTIWVDQVTVKLDQKKENFRFVFSKNISEKLFNDLFYKKFGQQWIMAYVLEVLPYVNQEILRQRYVYAYFLLRTFAAPDISHIRLINKTNKKGIQILGHMGMGEIPLDSEIAQIHETHIYFRDLVDAINAYFNSNYEDAIRKLITSIENFIRYNGLKRLRKETKSFFIDTINQNINYFCEMHQRDTAQDIIKTYLTRNKIVHDGERLTLIDGKQAFKDGLHAVLNIYKQFGDDEKTKLYADHLDLQYTASEAFIGGIPTLTSYERYLEDAKI